MGPAEEVAYLRNTVSSVTSIYILGNTKVGEA